jgi:hypothetical protein
VDHPSRPDARRRSVLGFVSILGGSLALVLSASARPALASNYTTAASTAVVFGVHEIALVGSVTTANPFDVAVRVRFTPASGEKNAVAVDAFYDGGTTWRARLYVSEPGAWRWTSQCLVDPSLDAKTGTFASRRAKLRGILRRHPDNPRRWITADGRWFLHISDTAYRLFHPDAQDAWQLYVRDAVDRGVTSLRVAALGGWGGSRHTRLDDANHWSRNDPWSFEPRADYARFDLAKFQTTDQRLIWLLDRYPDLYVQMILFGKRGYNEDTTGKFWLALPETVRQRTMRYMIARWSVFPNLYWLVVNDLHAGPKFPANQAFVREVGRFFAANDPGKHLISAGVQRFAGFPFSTPEDLSWVSYADVEDMNAVGARQIQAYGLDRTPLHVFMAEDRYEQDYGFYDDPAFFFRWLIWSWTLAGGSANYGGRYGVIHPYSQTDRPDLAWTGSDNTVYTGKPLHGLDSIRHVRAFFEKRALDLGRCEPDDSLVSDPDGATGTRSPKLMACGGRQILVYHPNAASDGMRARPVGNRVARLRIDLRRMPVPFAVEWYRPADGLSRAAPRISGGTVVEFVAPWQGSDAVLLLSSTTG